MTFFLPHRAGRAGCLWLCLLGAPALAQVPAGGDASIDAVETAAPETQPPAPAGRSTGARAPAGPRFDIDLQAPGDLQAFLLRHIELQRFRELRNLDASELQRLVLQAPDDLYQLLGTQGHFSPVLQIDGPFAEGPTPLGTVRIRVDPGPVTLVDSAQIFFRGDVADKAEAFPRREAVSAAWPLKPGERFTQSAWDSAKTAVLRELTTRRYPAGRIHNSLADIDPLTHRAHLTVELDSGSPVSVGEVQVQGAQRYGADTATHLVRLSGLTPGSDYDLEKLQDAQQRIADTGLYDSVFVTIEPPVDGQAAPVLVQVREALRQKLVLGVGGSTDNGARLSMEHTHHRVPGIGWRAISKLQLERDDQSLSSDWSSPPDDKGWRWIAGAQVARQIDGFDTTRSERLRAGRSQENHVLDRSLFLQYDRARASNSVLDTSPSTESALSANYAWTQRRFDQTPFPENGYGLGVELGAGTTLGSVRRPFTRAHARWLGYWPLGQPDPKAALSNGAAGARSRLLLRLEGGALWAQKSAPIPETQLFLTGGDTTVRGYALRDIGVAQADGGVSPGRYMAVGSLEWQRPIVRDGVLSPWEHVVFVDVGAVANNMPDLTPNWGVGTGVRYNSPVGPLQLDLAWGQRSRELRVHLNVGFSF